MARLDQKKQGLLFGQIEPAVQAVPEELADRPEHELLQAAGAARRPVLASLRVEELGGEASIVRSGLEVVAVAVVVTV